MSKSRLLINEPPLQVLPSLAVAIGLNEAIVVQQLHYWLENPRAGVERDGHKWVFNTYDEWRENFPFWSAATIQRIFTSLEKSGVVVSAQLDAKKHDMKKFYRIDYDQLCKMDHSKLLSSETATCYDDNKNTETTTEIKREIAQIFRKIESLKFPIDPKARFFVEDWLADFKDAPNQLEIIFRALDETARNGAKSLKYTDKILVGWAANGVPPTRDEQKSAAKSSGYQGRKSTASELSAVLAELAVS